MNMQDKEFMKDSFDFWQGAFETGVDDDAPDGAYFQMHKDIIDDLLEDCCMALGLDIPMGDSHDLYMAYLEVKEERGE